MRQPTPARHLCHRKVGKLLLTQYIRPEAMLALSLVVTDQTSQDLPLQALHSDPTCQKV